MSTCPATLSLAITDAAGRVTVPADVVSCRLEDEHPQRHEGNHVDGALIRWAVPVVKRGPGRPRKIPEQRTEQP